MRAPGGTWIAQCHGCDWREEGPRDRVFLEADRHWVYTAHPIERTQVWVEIPPIDLSEIEAEFWEAMRQAAAAGKAFEVLFAAMNGRTGLEELDLPPSATPAEVRSRYRAKLREIHPDAGGSGDGKAMDRLQETYARALREAGG